MADKSDVQKAQLESYDKIWAIASQALTSLWGSSWSWLNPAEGALKYEPGVPDIIKMSSAFDIKSVYDDIDKYANQLKAVKMPVLPNAPESVMLATQVWEDDFAEQLKQSLSAYVISMGIPDIAYQNAIFNEEYDRNLQTLNDLYDLADAKTGAKGFTYTNDFGNSLKLDAQQKYQFDKMQISRTISKLLTEWARQNYQFALEKGISLEQAHMDFTYKYCIGSVENYKNMMVALLEEYKLRLSTVIEPMDALIKEAASMIDYAKIDTDVSKANVQFKQTRSELEIREGLQRFQIESQNLLEVFKVQMEQIRASAQYSSQIAQATSQNVIGLFK